MAMVNADVSLPERTPVPKSEARRQGLRPAHISHPRADIKRDAAQDGLSKSRNVIDCGRL